MIIGVSFTIITIIISITITICRYSSILKVKILILILIANFQWREVREVWLPWWKVLVILISIQYTEYLCRKN